MVVTSYGGFISLHLCLQWFLVFGVCFMVLCDLTHGLRLVSGVGGALPCYCRVFCSFGVGLNFGVCLRDGRLVCYAVEVLLVVGACCGFGIWFTCTACCEMFSVLVDVGTLVAVYFYGSFLGFYDCAFAVWGFDLVLRWCLVWFGCLLLLALWRGMGFCEFCGLFGFGWAVDFLWVWAVSYGST